MKKLFLFVATAILIVSLSTGCSNRSEESASMKGEGEQKKEQKEINIFQFKVEIAEQLERMAKEYEEQTGVKVNVETVGGGADYGAALKAKLASGEEPEIFNNGGFAELDLYLDRAADLSDESWVPNVVEAAKAPTLRDGKLYGMPMNIEGYGFIYNKDLFEQAGITNLPKTLSELKEAAQKLKDHGITPFANGYSEWWILGIHNLNVGVAQQDDPDAFINGVKAGKQTFSSNALMKDWVNLLDTTLAFGNENALTTDYNTQVTLFASGKAAMMQQGNWTQVQLDKINPDLNLGLLPMPINDTGEKVDHIYVGVPNNWIVNKKSKYPEEAKKFLEWMVTSEAGQRYMIEEFKFIPAFTNIAFTPEQLGDIATAISQYNKEGKALGWHWPKWPDGTTQEFGAHMQAYVAGEISSQELLEAFDHVVQTMVNK